MTEREERTPCSCEASSRSRATWKSVPDDETPILGIASRPPPLLGVGTVDRTQGWIGETDQG